MIPHNKPTIGVKEVAAASAILSSGNIAQGKEVESFENDLCKYLGYDSGHALAVSSGSAALYMALLGAGLCKKINKIAIPAYSCSALKNAVLLFNATPIYCDTSYDSPNIDLSANSYNDVDITVAAHMFGMPMKISGEAIEDCAQAIGGFIDNKKVGTQTTISAFSFYATKPITSGGGGGCVVSKDLKIIEELRDLRDFDMKNDKKKRFNFQMTDLQAAIGRIQLERLDSFIEKRIFLADRYCEKGIPLWNRSKGGIDYRGLLRSNNQRKLIGHLSNKGIAAIIPIEDSELLCEKEKVPHAYELTQSLVSIPLYPSLTIAEQDYIIDAILEYADDEGSV